MKTNLGMRIPPEGRRILWFVANRTRWIQRQTFLQTNATLWL